MRPSARLMRRLTVTSCLISVALLATACGSGSTAAPATTVTVTVTAPASAAPSTSAPSSPAPSVLTPCAASDLKLAVGGSEGAAGTIYYRLDFTNLSSSACTMYGFPGVSFVSRAHGSQVGAPAARSNRGALELITLASGAVAHATLAVSDVLTSTNCKHPVAVNWLQVYPPDQFTALFVPLSRQGCADKKLVVMHVSQVTLST